MTEAATQTSGTRRRWWPWIAGALVIVGIVIVTGAPRTEGEPLDPRSTGAQGTKGLVLLLREHGARVDVTDATPALGSSGVVLVLKDNLSKAQQDGLAGWVSGGGTLVVADAVSELAPSAAFSRSFDAKLTRECDLPALGDVNRIAASDLPLYRPVPDGVNCFTVEAKKGQRRSFFLVARSQGQGTVVALGSADPFVNERLAKGDNSVLAVDLLAPQRGGVVTIMQPPRVGEGHRGLIELISPRIKIAFLELAIAFVVFCLWRGRRLGRPVVESQPVELAGSELVLAVGNLLQHAGRRGDAAALLRAELRRTIAERLSLGRDTPPEIVADIAASRTGVDREKILNALRDVPPGDDADLVALARSIEAVHQEVVHAK